MSDVTTYDPAAVIRQVQRRGKLDAIKIIEAKLADPEIKEFDLALWTAALKLLQEEVANLGL